MFFYFFMYKLSMKIAYSFSALGIHHRIFAADFLRRSTGCIAVQSLV